MPGPGPDPELSLQDALFFLKDFFTSLAASINPMVPGDTSEGERPGQGGESRSWLPHVPCSILDLGSFCLKLPERPTAGPAAPRRGSLRTQRQPAAHRTLQAVATAPLTSSPSTSGRVEVLWARLSENPASDQVKDRRVSSPFSPLQGVPLHL